MFFYYIRVYEYYRIFHPDLSYPECIWGADSNRTIYTNTSPPPLLKFESCLSPKLKFEEQF